VGRLAYQAWEQKFLGPELRVRDPGPDRLAGLVGQLELHRLLSLVLEDGGAVLLIRLETFSRAAAIPRH
jgi:hypothetical protein